MISPGLIYLVLSAALFAVAVVTHFHATALSVPLPEALTILTAILPILALVNAYIRPNLLLSARRQQHSSAIISYKHVPTALQTLQLLLTTILATILIQAVVPSRCVLEDRWMSMFRHRDSQAVRAIQDALECCGFNSVKDRAYPFGQPSTCAQTYGRSDSCRDKWRGVMQTSAGVDFGVVVAVALMQLLGLLLMKEGASWWTAWRIWGAAGRQWDGSTTTERQRRPLLTAPVEVDEDEEEQVAGTQDRSRTYGTTGDTGPRVEPSSVGGERNAWEE